MDLYQDNILDHYKNPRHHGVLKHKTASGISANPSCGDSLMVEVEIKDGVLIEASFSGEGCVLSQAGGSIILEEAIGKKVSEILTWNSKKIINLLKIDIGPTRLKCALLSLEALQQAIKSNSI